MPSANISTYSFTPERAMQVVLAARFEASGFGADWGNNQLTDLFCLQGASEQTSPAYRMTSTRTAYQIEQVFTLLAGVQATLGVRASISGASQASWWNTKAMLTLIEPAN